MEEFSAKMFLEATLVAELRLSESAIGGMVFGPSRHFAEAFAEKGQRLQSLLAAFLFR